MAESWISYDYGKTKQTLVIPPDPLIALVAEMEEAFKAAKHHYTGGVITRPLNAMREVLVELARQSAIR